MAEEAVTPGKPSKQSAGGAGPGDPFTSVRQAGPKVIVGQVSQDLGACGGGDQYQDHVLYLAAV
jgi:hypothetical protein